MSRKFFLLFFLAGVICGMLAPAATAKQLSSLRGIVVFTTADDFKLEGLPILVHTTSFGKYCSLCGQDSACCAYCDAPDCEGLVRETYPEGSIAEGISNFKFESDFEASESSSLCPPLSIKKGDSCSGNMALDSDYDTVWFSIEGYDYTSTKYDLNDVYNPDRWRYEIEESFELSYTDRDLVNKANGGGIFLEEPSEPFYADGIIPAEDIEFIIPSDKTEEIINETVDEDKDGVVIFKEDARNILRKNTKRATETIAWVIAIIAIAVFLVVYLVVKSKKR